MTRKQERREIDSLDFYLKNHTNDYGEESHTAMMMAIEALSRSENPNKWIGAEVLDKIRAEIDRQEKWLLQAGYNAYNVDIAFDAIKSVVAESEDKK